VKLPLLRKDFIIDERQILESHPNGARTPSPDRTILDERQGNHFQSLASAAGLSVLVEVHDEAELGRALAAGAQLVGCE